MVAPNWTQNRKKYKKYPRNNGGVNVVHFSPGKKKITIRVPANKVVNVPAFLKQYFEPKNINIQKNPNGTVRIVKHMGGGATSSSLLPIKNPTRNNINLWINKMYGTPGLKKGFFFKNVTNSGKTGTALTSLNRAGGIRTTYNVSKGKKSVRIGIGKMGQGAQAVVYLGYHDVKLKDPVSIKVFPFNKTFPENQQPAITEFKIGEKVHAVVPIHSPKYINIERTVGFVNSKNLNSITGSVNKNHQLVIFSEYFPGGDLRTWLSKVNVRMNEAALFDIVRQVLTTIVKIHDTYPGFRHNDLHPGNIFIDDSGTKPRAAIADFGMSCLTPSLCSHEVSRGNFVQNGIGKNTDERYDAHLFLNSLLKYGERFPRFKMYLHMVIPPGYNGKDGAYVSNYRLKYNINYPGLPSTKKMIELLQMDKVPQVILKKTPVVASITKPKVGIINLAIAKAKIIKKRQLPFTSANLQAIKLKNILASKEKDAAVIAQQILAVAEPKVVVKTKYLQFKKIVGNATKTKPTNVLALAKMIDPKKKPVLNSYIEKVLTTRRPAKNILNNYTKDKNVGSYTTRNFRKVLALKGYGPLSSKREAKTWTKAWTNKVGARRENLKLTQNANGRIRNNKRLLMGYKKDQLVHMATRFGISTTGKTKEQLIKNLWIH